MAKATSKAAASKAATEAESSDFDVDSAVAHAMQAVRTMQAHHMSTY